MSLTLRDVHSCTAQLWGMLSTVTGEAQSYEAVLVIRFFLGVRLHRSRVD